MSSTTNRAIFYNTAYLPLAQRLFSLASSTCTSMVSPPVIATSNGGIWSIGDPGIHGAAHLRVWGRGWQPHHARIVQAPMTVASESNCGSSYASPSNPSMIASQSHRHRCLFSSASSSGSVHLALSSLSSSHSGSVSMVCSSGYHTSSSSDMEESLGQLTIWWAPSLAIQAASPGMHST